MIALCVLSIFLWSNANRLFPPEAAHERIAIGLRPHARGQEPPRRFAQDVGRQLLIVTILMRNPLRDISRCSLDAWPLQRNVLHRTIVGRSDDRSEEHTSELQSIMSISYPVFCSKN